MKKPVKADPLVEKTAMVRIDPDGILLRRAPMVLAMLTDDKWDDGSTRETSTLLLFVDADRLKACFKDRALERSVFVTGESLEAILDTLETGLETDALEWRGYGREGKKK